MRRAINLTLFTLIIWTSLFASGRSAYSSGTGPVDALRAFTCSPLAIELGDSINGTLESGDCIDFNTALYDGYTFNAASSDLINVAMAAEGFAANLRLVQGTYPGGSVLATGADAGNGSRRIDAFSIPASGSYTIVASSNIAGVSGGYSLMLEPTNPRVDLIQRISTNPASPGSPVGFSVFFSTSVTGVDADDFSLTTTGLSGASIANVSGSGSIYTVSLNTGSGSGTVRLNVIDNDTVVNLLGTPLGGLGLGNGNFLNGPSYTISTPTPTPSPTPPSATVLVTNTNDDGGGSLRQAIANVVSGGSISFSPLFNLPQTIRLEGELSISGNVTINGPGASLLTISGNNNVRVFNIGGSQPGPTVVISGLTIANGRAPNNDFGGGIENNFGDLTLSNCIVTGNRVPGTGSLGSGGGIDSFQGRLTISATVISANTSNGFGGGIQNEDGELTINDSTIRGNGGRGGAGIVSVNSVTTISRSTISGNTAVTQGGGAFFQDTDLTITNSTVSGNAANGATAAGSGLILVVSDGNRTFRIINCTIAYNIAPLGYGGGVVVAGPTSGTASAILQSTIITNNTEPNLRSQNSTASITSLGFNLTNGTGNGFLTQPSDKIGADAALAPLANNGGPAFTHALLDSSQAVDSGLSTGLGTDQRGSSFLRVVDLSFPNASGGDGSDIGAYEVQSEPSALLATVSGRVLSPGGLSLRNSVVSLIDPQGVRRTATTSSFGVYSFGNVRSGESYVLTVSSKRYRFAVRTMLVTGDLNNVDFVGLE